MPTSARSGRNAIGNTSKRSARSSDTPIIWERCSVIASTIRTIPNLLTVSYFMMRYPFANRLFPNSVDAVQHVGQLGRPVILSDGDVVFQPHKVYRSGLFELFDGHVLIYVHKEHELEDVEQRYPADHYVLVDDKLRILDAIKKLWKSRVTTVFVRQGTMRTTPKCSRNIRRPTSAWSALATC